MIKIKLSSIGTNEKDLPIQDGENALEAVEKALSPLKLNEKSKDYFVYCINGLVVDRELFRHKVLSKDDIVLIAPKISGEDSGSLIKTAAIIAITVYTGGVLAGTGVAWLAAGTVGNALVTAGVTVVASALLNQMIPPPQPEGLDPATLNSGSSSVGSQMYSISGQANQVKKFGTVPKVYGSHRMFPLVAANPYTELETDPSNGKLVQFFYAIYDFGLGPCYVEDLKIGETPIGAYDDVSYNFVDLNAPVTSQGIWDNQNQNKFTLYRGDVSSESLSISLNGNRDGSYIKGNWVISPDPEEYQTVRNAAANSENYSQEITCTFVCPKGLYGFDASGNRDYREITLEVEFAKADGSGPWIPFNDLSSVSSFKYVGGQESLQTQNARILPPGDDVLLYQEVPSKIPHISNIDPFALAWAAQYYTKLSEVIIPKGSTYVALTSGSAAVGDYIVGNGVFLGAVTSIETPFSYPIGYQKFNLDRPIDKDTTVYKISRHYKFQNNVTTLEGTFYELPDGSYSPSFSETMQDNKLFRQRIQIKRAAIKRDDTSPVYATVRFSPRELGEYKVRVTRVQTNSPFNSTVQDEMTWVGLTTRFDVAPISTTKRHKFLEVRIRATNQLSGAIQNLSGVVSSALDTWNGTTWVKALTRNPAWVYVDLLTGEVNKKPISKSRLDISSILEWRDYCAELPAGDPYLVTYVSERFNCDFILDFSINLQGILNKVTGAAQATLNIVDGKYGVLIDKLRTTPVQIFTPRNSSGFSSTRLYTQKPHALKVSYIDPSAGWDTAETIVYDDGYDETNATEFEDVATFAVTTPDQAFRFGRYMLATNRLRQETISIQVDFEYLVCSRGDYVQITQDVMKVGGSPARVKSVSGNQITIDDGIETTVGTYGFTFRSIEGDIVTNTLTVISSDTFDLDGGVYPEVGDLIVIGLVGEITFDCLVKSIIPNGDLTATLTLIEKADGVYTAESSLLIGEYTPQISVTQDTEFIAPGEVENLTIVENSYRCLVGRRGIEYYIFLDWDVPPGAAFDIFEVYVDSGRGYDVYTATKDSQYTYIVNTDDLDVPHRFKILAVSATGKKLDLGAVGFVTATPLTKTARPSDVETLNIDITGETLQLFWPAITDCDLNEYLIRYSPNLDGTWETSVPLLRIGGNSTLAATQARTGIYLIKAIDLTGNESTNAAAAITTIPNLFGLNIIDSKNDFPALTGTTDRVVISGNALLLQETISGGPSNTEYETEGYYYYDSLLDLGEIYSVRLQSKIEAEGYSLQDLMSNWVTLDSVDVLIHGGFSDWDVEAQYRTTESFNVMSDWVTLSSIDPLSEGNQDLWTAWKKFIIGDATGRIFQFRLKLISNNVAITPRVIGGLITADMPDRIESYNDIVIPSGGDEVVHDPAFKGPGTTPNIQVSISDAQSGDYWTFDYKTLDSFYIRFFDVNDNPVARTADFAVKGYGRKALEII